MELFSIRIQRTFQLVSTSYTFFVKIFLAASPWKIFTKKNAAAIQIRFEKRLQGQTATDVTHG